MSLTSRRKVEQSKQWQAHRALGLRIKRQIQNPGAKLVSKSTSLFSPPHQRPAPPPPPRPPPPAPSQPPAPTRSMYLAVKLAPMAISGQVFASFSESCHYCVLGVTGFPGSAPRHSCVQNTRAERRNSIGRAWLRRWARSSADGSLVSLEALLELSRRASPSTARGLPARNLSDA